MFQYHVDQKVDFGSGCLTGLTYPTHPSNDFEGLDTGNIIPRFGHLELLVRDWVNYEAGLGSGVQTRMCQSLVGQYYGLGRQVAFKQHKIQTSKLGVFTYMDHEKIYCSLLLASKRTTNSWSC